MWKQGFSRVAGVDEVGRGSLAGPVVVSAVIFPVVKRKSPLLAQVRDSKRLSPKKREGLVSIIKAKSLDWAYGQATTNEIDRFGIMKATQMAMRRAIKALKTVDFVLVDAFYIPYLKGLSRQKQLAIAQGDGRCFSIAAASIIAKVHRDQMMTKLGKRFPLYKLQQHKGYGTAYHRGAIMKLGPKPFHRKTFISRYT